MLAPWKKRYDQHRQHIKKQRHYFANNLSSQSYGFPVVMYGCENWTIKNPKGDQSWTNPLVHPKGDQSWVFIGRTDVEAETPILWPPDMNNWLSRKDPDEGKDWRQEEKGTTEDEMFEWYHRLKGHEFEQAWGVGDGQRGLACFSPWGCKESGIPEQLNWTETTWRLSVPRWAT